MPAPFNTIDLGSLALSPGEAGRVDADLVIDPFGLGGQDYAPAGEHVAVRLDVSRTVAGHALRLRIETSLEGPCMRCLEAASYAVEIDAREIDQPGTDDEELRSPYVTEGVLDLTGWAHDAIALSLPQTLLCRADCAGLCPECGVSLNEGDPAEHVHERAPDPRWAKLRELSE